VSSQFLPFSVLEEMDRLSQCPLIIAHGSGLAERGFFHTTRSTDKLTGKGLALGGWKGDTAARAEGRIDQADAVPTIPTDQRTMGE
jgi:hypothetical protein